MIIADIIKELNSISPKDLKIAIKGLRNVYRVFPPTLKQEMLGEYSNTEYVLLSALRLQNESTETDEQAISNIYQDSK